MHGNSVIIIFTSDMICIELFNRFNMGSFSPNATHQFVYKKENSD